MGENPMPEWLTVGANVVEFQMTRNGEGGTAHIIEATVKSIGKRDVVLDNGSRYNVKRLSRSGGGTWASPTELLTPDDPRVARARRANVRVNRMRKANAAWDEFRRNPDQERAALLIRAVEQYAMKLAEGADKEGRESDG